MSLLPSVFLKGSIFSAGSALLVGVFGYLTRRLLANNLPADDFAFFYSVFALVSIIMIFIHFGSADVLLFELPGLLESGRKRCAGACYKFIKKFQSINVLYGMIVLIASFPLLKRYYFDYPVSLIDFVIFSLILWGTALENTVLFTLNSLKSFGFIAFLRVLKAGLFFLGACLCLYGDHLTALIVFCVLSTMLCSILGDIAIRKSKMLPCTVRLPEKLKKKIISSGMTFMILAGSGCITHDFGTIMLGFLSTPHEVVLFNIALPIAMIIQGMLGVLNVFTPMIAEYHARKAKDRLHKLFIRLCLLTAAVMIAAAAVLYFGGEFIIRLLFSEKFISARWSTIFMVEATLLFVPVRILLNLFNTIDQKQISLKTLLPMGISALILFPFLSYKYGASGTGLAVLLVTSVWLAACLFYYRSFMKHE